MTFEEINDLPEVDALEANDVLAVVVYRDSLAFKLGKVTVANLAATLPNTQQTAIADAETSHALNSTFDDTEAEAALDALGGKINSIIAALVAFGILAEAEE